MNGFAPQIGRNSVLQRPDCQHCLGRGVSPRGGGLALEGSHSQSFPVPPQIAPAEGPDASERMVIITGPPEAQFKVWWSRDGDGLGTWAGAR